MRALPSEHLAGWLGRQRWFAGRAATIAAVDLTAVGAPHEDDGLTVTLAVASVTDQQARTEHYLLPLAFTKGPAPTRDPVHSDDVEWFDALEHPASAAIVLGMLGRRTSSVEPSWIDERPLQLTALRRVPGEQSNTSLLSDGHIIKVIRRLQAGSNPEVEIGRALRGGAPVAQLSGWTRLGIDTRPVDALVVHRRIDAADGFALATADADRAAEGSPEEHFPGAAYELGIAVGAVHAELAEAFGQHQPDGFAAELSQRLLRRLDALADVRVLDPYAPAATAIFTDLARHPGRLAAHRVHGDLHLGQCLFAADGWRLIDFEGEPRRPLEERRRPDTPMRDLAGMLRSFDYAARWNAASARPATWQARAGEMFLEGYRLQRPDAIDEQVLDALVLDKALYEVGYEASYRPERVRIPLSAVAALCGSA